MNRLSAPVTGEYTVLAEVYDVLMSEVNYELWADFIDEILLEHHSEPVEILELACGTGTLALSLEEFDCYNITATDASSKMIEKAREKAAAIDSSINFMTMNFLSIDLEQKFDAVYMVFDSINYLHTEKDILNLFEQVRHVLNDKGIFIFDFTTPRNSVKSIKYLHNEKGKSKTNYDYYRTSSFDRKNRIHYNKFEIRLLDDNEQVIDTFREIHKQKIYTYTEMKSIIDKSDLKILAAYDGFQLNPVHEKSLRITMVLQ